MMDEYDLNDAPRGENKTRALELHSIAEIMRTENGRHFMWRCLQQSGTFTTTFNSDPTIHMMNTGKREYGLWLDAEIRQAAPDYYMIMLKEHINAR